LAIESSPEEQFDVCIVGLGPVGATLAALLTRYGVRVFAAEKSTEVYPLPRAAHFDDEIMRVFQQLGIAEEVLPHTQLAASYDFVNADREVLLRFENTGLKTPSGWFKAYMFHQPAVENALRALVQRSTRATVSLGCEFVQAETHADHIIAHFESGGLRRAVRARFLVGCDGAWSPVREGCGIELDDYGFDEPWLVIDARLTPGVTVPPSPLQLCDPARPTTCTQMGPGRHRWEFMLRPEDTPEQALQEASIRAWLKPWGAEHVEIERRAVYRFHGLVAKTWRKGRVLLAGDSAHQMPPFAGQGMCSGIRDAAGLSWRLALILNEQAGEALLDSYQLEREPHVREIVEQAISIGRVVCTLDPEVAAERDKRMLADRAAGRHAAAPSLKLKEGCLLPDAAGAGEIFPQPWAETGAGVVRLDDVLGDGAWLISDDEARRVDGAVRHFRLSSPALQPFAAELKAWLAEHGARAVLVRPDRYVFGAGDPDRLLREFHTRLKGDGQTSSAPPQPGEVVIGSST